MNKTAFILLLVLSSISVLGNDFISIKKITYSQGLSENTIMDIAQDANGYIWVGTREGLNRYDGYSCKNYFESPGKAGNLRSSSIQKIFIDSHSNIWVQSPAGIDFYQPETDSFKELKIELNGSFITRINDVVETANTKWLGCSTGLVGVNPESSQVVKYIDQFKSVQLLCEKNENEFWVYSDGGIHLFNSLTQRYSTTVEIPFSSRVLEMAWFNNSLWIYSNDGLWIYDGATLVSFKTFAEEQNAKAKLLIKKVDEVLITSLLVLENELWISTDGNGIFIIDSNNDFQIKNLTTNSQSNSISTNAIRCLFADMDKNMWIGTVHNGLNLLPQQRKKFFSLKYSGENPNVPYGNFSNFLEDKNNRLWAASFDGLCLLNQNSMTIEKFVEKGTIINTITIDWDGDIFLGTFNRGLLIYTPANDKIEKVQSAEFDLTGSINALVTDHNGDIWIGTNALYRFSKKTNNIEQITKADFSTVISLLEDQNNNIWVGTVNGLFQLNAETNSVISYSENKERPYKISKSWVSCLFEDSKGNIWLGTNGGGINRISKESHELTFYEKKEQLSSNVVHGIAEDKQGNIWYTTNSGVVKLVPQTGQINVYDYSDGLINNQYIDESIFLSTAGKMLCGGEKGIDYFIPEEIQSNLNPPRVIVNGHFFEEKSVAEDEHNRYQRLLANNDTLIFKYSQSYFGFEFTGIDFANSEKIKYAYWLEGFNSDWIYEKERRTVNYGHISPGEYVFKVKASNSDGIWSEVSKINVVINPPFAKTPLAFGMYVFGLALIFYFFYRYKLERKLLNNKLQYESKERQRVEELNQLKLRMFTHISHEFRTPLSLIIAPVQELIKQFKNSGKRLMELESIQNNAQKLQVLVNQVLEVRKIESGAIQIHKSNLDMVSFIKFSYESFYNWAKQKNIELTLESSEEELILNVDQGLMEKVIYNLLSNAIKYTEKGYVKVRLKTGDNYFYIEVVDSGIGILKEHQEKLFDMFYRVENGEYEIEGSGIGLSLCKELVELHEGKLSVQSVPNEGSCFIVQFPLPTEALIKDEIITTSREVGADVESALPNSEKATLLLVEDNEELRKFLSEKLAEHFAVFEAINGVQALECAKKQQPNIILSDVMMPEMDGWELCKKLKSDVEISHIPLILLTALSETNNTIKGLNLGADAYLAKPFNVDHVVSLMQNILKRREQLKIKYKKGEAESIDTAQLTELDKKLLEDARSKTIENLSQPDYSVQTLSELLGMSRVKLHLKLKALCDLTPSDFIMQIRLKEAVNLLKEKKYQMNEIADLTGFSTASHFSRVFKKQFGGTPSDFLKGKLKV